MDWYLAYSMYFIAIALMVLIVAALVVIPVVLVVRRRRDAEVEVVPVGSDC